MATKPPLGDRLYHAANSTRAVIFKLGELVQLSYEAYQNMWVTIDKSEDESFTLKYPIGQHPNGEAMVGETSYLKEDLKSHFSHLGHQELPLTGIYSLVTYTEAMLGDVIREVLLAYPEKIGSKRKLSMSAVLSADSIEDVHLAAAEALLNELSYKSPREFAEEISGIIGLNLLELPAFHRYIEVKATRDIFIHNKGRANSIYIEKAGTHARVKAGNFLPIDNNYFLGAYEASLQIIEYLLEKLHKQWHSCEYEASKATNDENVVSESDDSTTEI